MLNKPIENLRRLPDDLVDEFCDCMHPEAVAQARSHLLDEEGMLDAADLFSLLGDATRVRVLAALLAGELCVTDLATATEANRTTISHQLRVLRSRGVVSRRRVGKVVYYTIADPRVLSILNTALPEIEMRQEASAQ